MPTYTAKNYSHLLGTEGLSDTLLTNHFTLYEGYVTNTNKLIELLETKEIGTPEYSELQRRFGWEWNGIRLHEYYFGNMKKGGSVLSDGPLKEQIEKSFGSFENWQKRFFGIGAMRGIGWVLLVQDEESGELFNLWINEHDAGHLAGARILLVMDVFEHAFVLDYGVKKADYIAAFSKAIDWETVSARFQK
ncbi:MAG: superoxide dismutase [Candidatus Moranbacteria bacterium RIFCSPHIGHO2_01_FULL_55_24]|nr:MAG: superoxide dismutase [Candidatus Moranbacteria bacterium RIFCSPHIGHO2_01_FULL_55_24]